MQGMFMTQESQSNPYNMQAVCVDVLERLESDKYAGHIQERGERIKAALDASEKAERNLLIRQLWAKRGKRYQQCSFENFEVGFQGQREALLRLMDYAREIKSRVSSGQNVILVGPTGTGKDHLLAALVHRALAAGYTVEWQTGATLWTDLRHAIQSSRERELLRCCTRPDVLVLSDPVPPHVEPTNYERAILYFIVDQRYSRCRPTWVSINAASREDAASRLGAAVVDRLRDGALSIACDWPGYRQSRKE